MRLLIVKLGAIGDIVHALPVLTAIRHSMPDAEISWAVEESTAEILRDNPMIDRLIEIDTRSLRGGKVMEDILLDVSQQVRDLRKYEFDMAIDFQGLWKSAAVAKLSRASRRWGFGRDALREPSSRLLLTDTVDTPPEIHVVRKNLALAAGALAIDVPKHNFEFPVAIGDEHRAEAATIAGHAEGEFAILNPGGGWVTKLWHAEKFGELADRLWGEFGMASVVTTTASESALAEKVAANSRSGHTIVAQPSLKGLFGLAKRASLYIGGDTGPTHIAVAAGAKIVGLFGPTEWWRNGSVNTDDICVERTDIGCRVNCHRRTCDNWICMDSDVETVLAAIRVRLQTTATA